MKTIGILLPRSTYYDTISFDMIEGLRSGLRAIGMNDVRIVTENIGFGAEKQQCYRSAEKLILEENVSVVFAYVCQRTAQLLRPLFLASKRLLIVLDAGANMPLEWPQSPNILYHSLNNSAGAYLSSELALKDGFTNAGMVTGYYDGGYLHTYAITNGFMSNGGIMKFNIVTGYTKQDFSMSALPVHLEANPDSCLLSIFSGDFCEWFFHELKQLYNGNCPPVYMPPFAFEELMLSRAVFPGESVKGIAAWSSKLDLPENIKFCQAMEEAGRNATLFSLLGWEAAILTPAVFEAINQNKNDVAAASNAIKEATFNTPRGTIAFHGESNYSYGKMYEVRVVEGQNGFCQLAVTGESNNVKNTLTKLAECEMQQALSGWYNSYTCN